MKWIKRGLILAPQKTKYWNQKYCMMPTPIHFPELGLIRIFFGTSDIHNNGVTTYIDVNDENPSLVLNNTEEITLNYGMPGFFDDSGSIPSSILRVAKKYLLYYVGFQRCEKVPYMLFSGLAKSIDGKMFTRVSNSPIIERDIINTISNAAPFVIYDDGIYKMWFWMGKEWTKLNNKDYIKAEIFYATSSDGINWTKSKEGCIKLNENFEFSVGRPCVLKEHGIYKMWYSIRYIDKLYRIGYAESVDGIIWNRKDSNVGIDVSESGWDSEMICYPAVIKVKEKTFMFYNGNNNGESGFGFAELINN